MSAQPERPPNIPTEASARWDATYKRRGAAGVSWYQAEPAVSLELIEATGVPHNAAIIDVGGGGSNLVDHLVGRGFTDISVLDISAVALAETRARLDTVESVQWIHQDLLAFEPSRPYGLWHDRAVFHFLVAESDRDAYRDILLSSLAPAGLAVIGTFAADGPESCSGLPVARYSETDLVAALGARFTPVAHRREEHRTPSGSIQPFTWVSVRAN